MDIRIALGQQAIALGRTTALPSALSKQQGAKKTDKSAFEHLLLQKIHSSQNADGFHISAHAQKRLFERNISMNQGLISSMNSAFNELALKGAKDSLVITNEGAFVVNVPSRTVVTALGSSDINGSVITNIDSVSVKYD